MKCHGSAAGSFAPSQIQDPWFDPKLQLMYVWSFSCSVYALMGFLWVHKIPPKNMMVGGSSNLPLVCENALVWCTGIPPRVHGLMATVLKRGNLFFIHFTFLVGSCWQQANKVSPYAWLLIPAPREGSQMFPSQLWYITKSLQWVLVLSLAGADQGASF